MELVYITEKKTQHMTFKAHTSCLQGRLYVMYLWFPSRSWDNPDHIIRVHFLLHKAPFRRYYSTTVFTGWVLLAMTSKLTFTWQTGSPIKHQMFAEFRGLGYGRSTLLQNTLMHVLPDGTIKSDRVCKIIIMLVQCKEKNNKDSGTVINALGGFTDYMFWCCLSAQTCTHSCYFSPAWVFLAAPPLFPSPVCTSNLCLLATCLTPPVPPVPPVPSLALRCYLMIELDTLAAG